MLEIADVNKSFDGIMALMGVSFQVSRGSITAIIGPNGGGKTTLLNVINGIYLPNAGAVYFEGDNISALRPHEVARLGITRTFQSLQLFQNMSVLENVMVGFHTRTSCGFIGCLARTLKLRREEKTVREKAFKMLDFVNLTGREGQAASSLSCGDQKRLELARALISRPKMILLDEPVSGLNGLETKQIAALICRLRESGLTVLLVEHDMNFVMQVADRVVVLNYGEKIAEGTAAEIQDNDKVVAAYLGDY